MTAQEKVDLLLTVGAKITCDDTNENFRNFGDLPPFYDEAKFKRGQQFYSKHVFALFFSKLLGLLVTLCVPSVLKLLIFTDMSNTPFKAYKRYVATIFHMTIWYRKDFSPGSDLWKSVRLVRGMHNSASRRGCKVGLSRISQRDMAITQFGFMGFAICKTEKIGIHGATEEELDAFIHLWRVIGYLMGMEDRFNICSGSVQQTKEICDLLLEKVFIPEVEKQNPDFLRMTSALITGLWVLNPFLETRGFMTYLYIIMGENNNLLREEIDSYKGPAVNAIIWTVRNLQHNFCRIVLNFLQILALWLISYFPFLAYYRYGLFNSRVHIFNS